MLSVPHALTGAYVASKLPHPLLYIPLAVAFHYLEDWIPHWDVGTGLSKGTRKRSTAFKLELIDLTITVGLMYLFWHTEPQVLQYHIWAGAFAGLVPDFIEAPRNFLKWEPAIFKPFNDVHGKFHFSTPNWVVGLLPQIVVVLMIWFLR
ncbi:MAG: hypothetical protein COY81_03705 [Candidatus Pacebacteria bacterium CG_4_10_14_0_8_um_filter_43_12]|nr:MAG: hypothetical protein COU66_02770 [Candidatus Pacebacteria bacterium CG10_big_fil_rev_8_21_14_0_10_44_11]PIY79237.1 MAG: hypothetical protein COY81_03705 [Candidatus Pacebacteria bacterium CG_4_10_14_0_8_um_filter_43_12]